ncbi:entericidin A/B family lipoprotein [Amantichitinum ursilacus]|uniref:Entericidin A n=1 Tax=Amantichitinum ursilacus TaxID=857265 RepID=A0A0N0XIP4_9NEIS|nr:entericidin A/B family lipoprotein [Amantichitinum ursilacus]KPC52927.1 entericidin A [Amantichitinum ursilacus]
MKSLLIVVIAVCALTACNTVHGFGQDLQKVGEKIEGK